MANYAKTNIGNEGRVELHETLSLTGAEISINKLPAGASVGSSTLARNKNYYKPQKCGLFYVKFYLFLCCTELYFLFICDIMRYETQL